MLRYNKGESRYTVVPPKSWTKNLTFWGCLYWQNIVMNINEGLSKNI